ncbi:MAG TPA: MBL fold metallo-hydrolase, partial [Thermoanaerobaculia bacterium]
YIASLRKLREREPRRIFPAHGPVRDDAVALIDEYIAHRLDRERQVIAALGGGARTIPELRQAVYPELDPRLRRGAEVQIHAHLSKLMAEGIVVQHGETYTLE